MDARLLKEEGELRTPTKRQKQETEKVVSSKYGVYGLRLIGLFLQSLRIVSV